MQVNLCCYVFLHLNIKLILELFEVITRAKCFSTPRASITLNSPNLKKATQQYIYIYM